MSEPRISVVVTSYSRPRMLRECLMSIAAARPYEVYVADDGSDIPDFNVAVTVGRALYGRVKYGIEANPPLSVDARMTTKRQGELINRTFAYCTGEIFHLVCDDDLVHESWYDSLRAEWTANPRREFVRGTWLVFNDGDEPSESDPPCPLDGRQLTAGNFAWHASLTRERGCAWPTDKVNCLDNGFLWSLQGHGIDQFNAPHVGFAGWRREHSLANGWFADGMGNHTPAYRAVLAAGGLE